MPKTTTTIRAFAKSLGVSHTAVQKAVASGRLAKSVVRDAKGRPVIVDAGLARAEWGQQARPTRARYSTTLVEAQRRVALQRARGLKLANDQKSGRLVEVSKVAREAFESARTIRDAMLNLPSRLSAELFAAPDEPTLRARLEAEIRLVLTSAGDTLAHVS
jgi:hypothetical protein